MAKFLVCIVAVVSAVVSPEEEEDSCLQVTNSDALPMSDVVENATLDDSKFQRLHSEINDVGEIDEPDDEWLLEADSEKFFTDDADAQIMPSDQKKIATQWVSINAFSACGADQSGQIATVAQQTLEACTAKCAKTMGCLAIDYFRRTKNCNLMQSVCTNPHLHNDGAISMRPECVASETFHGNFAKFLANAANRIKQFLGAYKGKLTQEAAFDVLGKFPIQLTNMNVEGGNEFTDWSFQLQASDLKDGGARIFRLAVKHFKPQAHKLASQSKTKVENLLSARLTYAADLHVPLPCPI